MLQDRRTHPIFIHSTIDDMICLSPNAMRVYMHIARRANNRDGSAWPSYQSIGDHCFVSVYKHPDTRRKYAIEAIDELIAAKLIEKTERIGKKGQQTNVYTLVDPTVESQPGVTVESQPGVTVESQPGVTVESQPGVTVESPKDTPIEDTPIEDTPIENAAAQPTLKPSDHPAVKAYREIVERFPNKTQMKMIAEADPPIANWIRAIRSWIGRGYNPTNIEVMLEWAENPSLMERFSGNTNSKETMRNRKEANDGDNGEDEDNGGWDADELIAIKAARDAGDYALAGQIGREGNKRWKERMSQVQGHRLAGR